MNGPLDPKLWLVWWEWKPLEKVTWIYVHGRCVSAWQTTCSRSDLRATTSWPLFNTTASIVFVYALTARQKQIKSGGGRSWRRSMRQLCVPRFFGWWVVAGNKPFCSDGCRRSCQVSTEEIKREIKQPAGRPDGQGDAGSNQMGVLHSHSAQGSHHTTAARDKNGRAGTEIGVQCRQIRTTTPQQLGTRNCW